MSRPRVFCIRRLFVGGNTEVTSDRVEQTRSENACVRSYTIIVYIFDPRAGLPSAVTIHTCAYKLLLSYGRRTFMRVHVAVGLIDVLHCSDEEGLLEQTALELLNFAE